MVWLYGCMLTWAWWIVAVLPLSSKRRRSRLAGEGMEWECPPIPIPCRWAILPSGTQRTVEAIATVSRPDALHLANTASPPTQRHGLYAGTEEMTLEWGLCKSVA